MKKRGELTTQQIVVLVVLIASFAVLLYFILNLNLGKETDAEICHNSVVTRGSSSLLSESFPLKCQRQYVCFTKDGSCESMTNPELVKVKTEDDVYKNLADEMADCWWMFGEGKINYVGSDLIPQNYCSICDQVSFDDSVQEIFGSSTFDKKNFYEYLENTEKSDGTSYLDYFGLKGFSGYSGNFGTVSLAKQHYIAMSITSDVNKWGWAGIVAGTLAVAPMTGGLSAVVVGAIFVKEYADSDGVVVAPVIQSLNGQQYLPPYLVEVNSEEFDFLNCNSITTLS